MAGMEATVVMLGPPGSGKGTQAARLRDGLGYEVLSTGELLRRARAAGTELGRRAGEYMDRGELVPDELVVTLIEDAIHRLGERRIVFDGFPRTVAQARALDRALAARGRRVDAAILIDIPDDEVVRPNPLAPPGALGRHARHSPRTAARLSRPDRAARRPLRGASAAATRRRRPPDRFRRARGPRRVDAGAAARAPRGWPPARARQLPVLVRRCRRADASGVGTRRVLLAALTVLLAGMASPAAAQVEFRKDRLAQPRGQTPPVERLLVQFRQDTSE